MENMLKVKLGDFKTFRVGCALRSPNKARSENLALIYDTGASTTSITRDILERLGYSDFKQATHVKRTAQGFAQLQTCIISELVISKRFIMHNIKVDILEGDSSPSFGGVIGMDFISMVTSVISGREGTLEITL